MHGEFPSVTNAALIFVFSLLLLCFAMCFCFVLAQCLFVPVLLLMCYQIVFVFCNFYTFICLSMYVLLFSCLVVKSFMHLSKSKFHVLSWFSPCLDFCFVIKYYSVGEHGSVAS